MAKRNLFNELKDGFEALQAEREGKLTLKTYPVEDKPKATISGEEIAAIRHKLHMSQAVFASVLRVEKRTLERWEHGQGAHGASAMLIKLVEKYPDTLDRVSNL